MTEPVPPPPPIDAEVDLTDFAYMPLQVARLRKSKAWLICKRCPEFAFYMLNLWSASWHEKPAGSLEDDDDVLADLAMCPPKEWPKLREEVMRGWVKCTDGRLYHPVICEIARPIWKKKKSFLNRVSRRLQMVSAEWARLRAAVFKRDGYTCQYCGAKGRRLECDHVVPVSRGGITALINLVTACLSCNRSKGNRTVEEWRGARGL